ncbi:hypothetical protein T10_10335 [Trichinella papuae]|uniref:Uncharacterized protein n=1 Tax=Trichinella papuae TaxID=268474 RepID=A0A0V1MNI0_9BILA|nr:hypothetical protein T10_10335 [Trichinella papuae]
MKTGWNVVTGGMCFSPFGSTKVVTISIFLPHSSRSQRRHPRSVLTIHPNRLNRRTALGQQSSCHEQQSPIFC